MNRDTAGRAAVLLVTVLVATSTMVVGVSAGVPRTAGDAAVDASGVSPETAHANGGGLVESTGMGAGTLQTSDDSIDPADEIYVKENGDAVVVYENSSDGGTAEFGVDVSANVFYALVEAPVEVNRPCGWDLTAVVTPDRLRANGSLVVPRTGELAAVEEFSLDASGVTTNDTNQFDASASATINNSELEQDMQIARVVESASVDGNLSTTPTEFRTATEFQATTLQQLGPERHEQFTLTETDGDYTVDASRNYIVNEFFVDSYDTRSEAKQTIAAQFGAAAQQFGGEASVTIQSYSFDSSTNRLDIEFTVEYTGVEQGIAEAAAAQLAASEEIDLNQTQIETFKTRFQRLNIDEVSTRVDLEGTSVSGYYRIDLENYDEWVRAGLTLAEASESETITQSDIDRVRARLEAQDQADFRQRFEYAASLDQPDDQLTSVSAELQYRTTNWGAFVDALGNRGGAAVDREFDLTARTEGDQITVEGSLNVTGRQVIENALEGGLNRSDVEMTRFARALRNAELEKAKFDLSQDGETVRIEAGAKFNDLSEARDALVETSGVPRFTEIVGRTEGDTVRSYVYVENAVEPGASEDDVRALPYVDSETEVNMPGTWDRDFPSVDTQRAADFLDVSLEPGDGGDGGVVVSNVNAPSSVSTETPFTFSGVITNTGSSQTTVTVEGSYAGAPVGSRTITLDAGASRTVAFSTVSQSVAGTHTATISTADDQGTATVEVVGQEFVCAASTGDPHITTFGGASYDFMDAGDYALVRETSGQNPLRIHVRQVPVSDSVSNNNATATMVGGDRVVIDASNDTPLAVNGEATPVEDGSSVPVGDGGEVRRQGSTYTVVYPGDDAQADASDGRLTVNVVGARIDVEVCLHPDRDTPVEGLVGDTDDESSDDIAFDNGTALDRPLDSDVLYGQFSEDWQVTGADNLFENDYTVENFPRSVVTVADLSDEERARAEAVLEDTCLEPGTPQYNDALLDVALTGDESYVASACQVARDDVEDADAGGISVALQPAETSVEPGETTQLDIVVEGIDDGVGSYELIVNSSNTSRATITDVVDRIGGSPRTSSAPDGSGIRAAAFNGDTANTGPVTIATVNVTAQAGASGEVEIPLDVDSVSNESGSQYGIGPTPGTTLTVGQAGCPEVIAGSPATDPDDDGLCEDVNGDGDATPGDATVLFNAIFDNNPAVTNNVDSFDFNDDGGLTPGDATVLFNEIFG